MSYDDNLDDIHIPLRMGVGRALSDGFDATKRNFVAWLIVGIVSYFGSMLLQLTCIGLVALPSLLWGVQRFTLETLDGEPEWNVVGSGFEDFKTSFVAIAGTQLGLFVAVIPGVLIGSIFIFGGVMGQEMMSPGADMPAILLAGMAIGLVIILVGYIPLFRLMLSPYYAIDQGMGPMEALKTSWRDTDGNVLTMFGLLFASTFVVLIGELMCFVGLIPAMMIVQAAMASAYQQMAGRGKYSE